MPNSVDRHSPSGSFRLIVALVATGAMCVQNAGSALAFGWALIHGAGPAAVAATDKENLLVLPEGRRR